jgi:hypothetical protein
MSEFTLLLHDHLLDGSGSFDHTKYAIPPLSSLAAAMLSVGGPTCEYSLSFAHRQEYTEYSWDIQLAGEALTEALREEIHAILLREPREKSWRRLDTAERK